MTRINVQGGVSNCYDTCLNEVNVIYTIEQRTRYFKQNHEHK